jgi:hypothetical protein
MFDAATARRCARQRSASIRLRPTDITAWSISGKVETGFPSENATNAEKLEHVQFPLKLNML